MENIDIVINKQTRMIDEISKTVIGNDGENLQENLVFSFNDEFVNGQARLELLMPDKTKTWLSLTQNEETYQLPVKSLLTKIGKIYMQLVIDEGTDEESIPIFKSNIFYVIVNKSINAVGEEPPEGYTSWLEIANTKLNQIDNLDIEAEKVGTTTTITITKKDGTTETRQVLDGNGIASIITQESQVDEGNNVITITDTNGQVTTFIVKNGSKGNTGAPGQIKMLIVNELPLTGSGDTLYFVPKNNPEQEDLYDEYVWLNNHWEPIGEKQITIDLSDYYTKQETNTLLDEKANTSDIPRATSDLLNDNNFVEDTDYATNNVGGVIKTGNGFGVVNGYASANTRPYSQYISDATNYFISKGTLENVITGKQLVNQTYVDNLVGDINTALDTINGEVI